MYFVCMLYRWCDIYTAENECDCDVDVIVNVIVIVIVVCQCSGFKAVCTVFGFCFARRFRRLVL